MFIASKRNIILPGSDGKTSVRVSKDFVGDIPDWAADTAYFRALVADGKIVAPENHSDKALEGGGKRGGRGKGKGKPAEEDKTQQAAEEDKTQQAAEEDKTQQAAEEDKTQQPGDELEPAGGE